MRTVLKTNVSRTLSQEQHHPITVFVDIERIRKWVNLCISSNQIMVCQVKTNRSIMRL